MTDLKGMGGGESVTAPYRCPSPCDPDCEVSGWGCHEAHDDPKRREHDPAACQALMLSGNLRHLLDGGWRVAFGRLPKPPDPVQPWHLTMASGEDARDMTCLYGVSPGDLAAQAVELARGEGIAP